MIMTGPCFEPSDSVTCRFQDVAVDGMYVSEDQLLCVTPVMKNVGEVEVMLEIKSKNGTERRLQTSFFAGQFLL